MMENGSISSTADRMPSSQGCRAMRFIAESLPFLLYRPFFPFLLYHSWSAQSFTGCCSRKGYNQAMLVAIIFMRLFEILFFLGVAGSMVVVVLSFIEDLQLLVGE